MVEAKPNLSNKKDMKVFKTVIEAVDYLNEVTGYPMDAESWRLIGKLHVYIEVINSGGSNNEIPQL